MFPHVFRLHHGQQTKRYGTQYIGVTNDLIRRVYEHKIEAVPGVTSWHQVHTLVWFEQTDLIITAIQHEKQLKNWQRRWKIRLIEHTNPY